jgi:hypothetical protein
VLDADAQAIIDILAIRWEIEVLFEDCRDLLGHDHFQLTSATAIVRY